MQSSWITQAIAALSSASGHVTCCGSSGSRSRSSLSESGGGDGDELSGCAHESFKKAERKTTVRQQTGGCKRQQLEAEVISIRNKSCTFSQRDWCMRHGAVQQGMRNSPSLHSYTDIQASHLTEIYACILTTSY